MFGSYCLEIIFLLYFASYIIFFWLLPFLPLLLLLLFVLPFSFFNFSSLHYTSSFLSLSFLFSFSSPSPSSSSSSSSYSSSSMDNRAFKANQTLMIKMYVLQSLSYDKQLKFYISFFFPISGVMEKEWTVSDWLSTKGWTRLATELYRFVPKMIFLMFKIIKIK